MSEYTQADNCRPGPRRCRGVCAGHVQQIARFYDGDFADHVNGMVSHRHAGGHQSISFYTSLFDPLRFEVEDRFADGERLQVVGFCVEPSTAAR